MKQGLFKSKIERCPKVVLISNTGGADTHAKYAS